MSTVGEKVIERFTGYAPNGYTFMETLGENRGPTVDRWQAEWRMRGEPWCGIAEAGVVREVPGAWTAYRGGDFLSPSVAVIEANGRGLGWRWDGGRIPAGAVATWGGDDHTNMVALDHGVMGGGFTAVGGNESNGIKVTERSAFDCRLWVPPAINVPPIAVPAYDFGLEDVRAEGRQIVLATFLTAKSRDRRLNAIRNARNRRPDETDAEYARRVPERERRAAAYRKYHPRPHRRGKGPGTRYLIIGGPVRYYGPYDTSEQRQAALRILAPRLRAFWHLNDRDVVLRRYRVPEKDYIEALEARREWLARN